MPTYRWGCECGEEREELSLGFDPPPLTCNCGRVMKKQFTPCANLMFADNANPKYDDMRAKHRAWYESADCQDKLKSGELIHVQDKS